MSGVEQLQYLSWLLYLIIFVVVLVRTVCRPTPAHLDMTLFFGAAAIVIVSTTLTSKFRLLPGWVAEDVVPGAAAAFGYLLLRLVNDFSQVPTLLMRAVEVGMLALIVAVVVLPAPLPTSIALGLVVYLALVIAYDTWSFARHAAHTRGVTRRRMQAAAAGSLCLDLDLIMVGLGITMPSIAPVVSEIGAALGLGSGICYFVGFAPPTWLRRAWQEPEVRALLARATSMAQLQDIRDIVDELERRAADAVGAPAARIALWDADASRLQIYMGREVVPLPQLPRAWRHQRATLVTNVTSRDAPNASLAELYKAKAVLGAPITAYEKRIGVLLVYAPRAPVFANSDLELIQLLADQAAVILENRTLLEEAAQVRAREEATRLKEDFLSSAAHDLKTPLTGIVTQAQVLRRRAERDPAAPADRVGLDRLLAQSHRLKSLVLELLDVSRLEHGSLLGQREDLDLTELVRTLAEREAARWQRVQLNADATVRAAVDPARLEQVMTNLIENALKYSPDQTAVLVSVWSENGEARLSVQDKGIGIPAQDQPLVFERFHRARNVDDRRFVGMGLGLYITRVIVEEHGGRIWVQSTPGIGSTFFVALPTSGAGATEREAGSTQVAP